MKYIIARVGKDYRIFKQEPNGWYRQFATTGNDGDARTLVNALNEAG